MLFSTPLPPPNQTNSFRRKFRKENMIISNLPYYVKFS